MLVEMVSLNLPVPGFQDNRVLQVVGAGLMTLFDKHKLLGAELTNYLLMDHAKLTMGDHAAELCDNDPDFDMIFTGACSGLQTALAMNIDAMETFATQIDGISDIMMFEYPELIRMVIREVPLGVTPIAGDYNPYVSECVDPISDLLREVIV